jgi:SAM-dependent methyltransferase
MMRAISCDLCGDPGYRVVYRTADRRFPLEGSFQMVECLNCGLLYLNPQPEFKELEPYYPEEGYDVYERAGIAGNIVDNEKLNFWRGAREILRRPMKRMIPSLREEIERELHWLGPLRSGIRVLDVGCGLSDALSVYREKGAMTYGLDINARVCEEGTKRGHRMFCGQLPEAGFESRFFDVIRFQQSLEHMFSPRDTLLEARRILKHDGRVWLSVPNHQSIQAKIFGRWFYTIDSPRHLFGFTPQTITRLLNETGFKTDHFHTYSMPGGFSFSMEYWLNDHFRRAEPFYYGQIKVKWWYIVTEALLFFPGIIMNSFDLGEYIAVGGRIS